MDTQKWGSKVEHQVTLHMLSDELKADLPRSIHHEQPPLDSWNGQRRANRRPQKEKVWLIKIWVRRTPNFPAQLSQMSIRQSKMIDRRPWKNACDQVKRKLKKRCQTHEGWFEILTRLKDSSAEKWCLLRQVARAKQSHLMVVIES